MMIAYMTKAARNLISQLGVTQVEVHADHGLDWAPSMIHPEAQERRRRQLHILSTTAGGSTRGPGPAASS
jgi:metal-sulfur cluster biosynthetic enzyme